MKKFLLAAILMVGGLTQAQKFEITAGYGSPSLQSQTLELVKIIGLSWAGYQSPESKGVANLGFHYYTESEKWRFGVEGMYESFGTTDKISNMNYVSVIPNVDYMWLNPEKKFQLYSGIGIGVNLINTTHRASAEDSEEKENDTFFGYNITPIGLRYGGDFGVFLELNIGMKGFAQGGISYKF